MRHNNVDFGGGGGDGMGGGGGAGGGFANFQGSRREMEKQRLQVG
jgi:hypothetical protein